ncbi:hypothetical protein Poli38472_011676 [Pythium oligandrum]|uniref:Uncharacterized protein n=1 Tax=Pythium oligandrum TaxID=41045 RepID=A0A8K1C8D2_PYTOL|nr:hypothetical protein Poli38472_011676 [Pythium oligandrum]|eukprot:TMW58088.1 hypothetical protein Poli38472_011676 [Pythium oligandrum]
MSTQQSDSGLFVEEADDTELLIAALAFLDEDSSGSASAEDAFLSCPGIESCGSEHVHLTKEDDKTSPTHEGGDKFVTNEKKNRNAKKRKWRNAPKEELEQLRVAVEGLEARLAGLKRREDGSESNAMTTDSMWSQIADRQLKAREGSVRENARLRALLEEHVRTAKSLGRMLIKVQSTGEESRSDKRLRANGTSNPLDDPAYEATARQTVLDMYHEVDRIASDPRYQEQDLAPTFYVADLGANEEGRIQIEVLETRQLPFELDVTANALWDMWIHRHFGPLEAKDVQGIELTQDSFIRRFDGEMRTESERTRFAFKTVTRRFSEPNRVVTVAVIMMQPTFLNGRPSDGVYMRTQVWNIINRTTDTHGNPATRRLVYKLVSPEVFDTVGSISDREEDLHMLKTYVIGNAATGAESQNQVLENKLVESLASLHWSRYAKD